MEPNKKKGSVNISVRPARKGFFLSFLMIVLYLVVVIFIELRLRASGIDQKTLTFLTLILLFLSFATFVYIHIRIYSKKLNISESSLVMDEGILNKHHLTIRYPNITEIGVTQNFFARMLNYGNLYIRTSGASQKEFRIDKISHPIHVKNIIEKFSGMNR
ncbi:PH domain-containing protein [Candidatus Woesearchaeota archaeon]|nr:PH domain-containing protein [Candidatus Woesearchaeota archaeon]